MNRNVDPEIEEYLAGLKQRAKAFAAQRQCYIKEKPTMKFRLSKFMPVRFKTSYKLVVNGATTSAQTSTWWQWRDRIFNHKAVAS